MTKIELHDTKGNIRNISVRNMDGDTFRAYLARFKTHCAIEGSTYEYNHFANWMRKHHGIELESQAELLERVDM